MLYHPKRAVQARELNQSQTLIQKQIERFGNHVFVDGTIVDGCEFQFDNNVTYVKLRDRNANGSLIDVTGWGNNFVTGLTSGVKGFIVDINTGAEVSAPNYNTLYVKLTGANGVNRQFANNENLRIYTSANVYVGSANTITANPVGLTTRFSVNEGIVYHKGFFVRAGAQGIILDRYSTTPSYQVGFQTDESIITSDTDTTLLSNAQGTENENAPGADRLKLTPTLVKRRLTDTSNTNVLFPIFEIEDGVVRVVRQ